MAALFALGRLPSVAQEIGQDFRITHIGPDGTPSWDAAEATVAYNPAADVYLAAYQVDTLGASDAALEGDATEIQIQLLNGAGAPVGPATVISQTGPAGDARFDAALPDVAYNASAGEFLVVWQSDHEGDNAFEIYGQRLDGATGAEIGPDFKISSTGLNGDTNFDAIHGRVAWSVESNRYLVVFQAGGTVAGKRDHEIWAQRLAANGTPVGAAIAISGPDGDPDRDGIHPDVAWSAAANVFAVVWEGEVSENESQIFCELRHALTGDRVGNDNQQVSEQGPAGVSHFDADDPAVAYSSTSGKLLVVWTGDASIGAGSGTGDDDEEEIFVRLLSGANGLPAGAQVRASNTGPDGNPLFDAVSPKVAWNSNRHVFVTVWAGEEQADGEVEIFGQEIDDASAAPTGPDDFRVSDMGLDGQSAFGAAAPAIVYAPSHQEALVLWEGDDVVDDEHEIYGQLLGPGPSQPCQATTTRLCLRDGLFSLEVNWETRAGVTGVGHAVQLTSDTGYFWFFQDSNVEVVIKILDGRPVNGYFWVFYGALSDVQYTITVANNFTGKGKVYFNPQRNLASVADTSAFPNSSEPAVRLAAPPPFAVNAAAPADSRSVERAVCQPTATALCLNQSQFEVKVTWRTRQGATGVGQAVPLTSDTGWFWFFNSANLELMIKVLDGRAVNGSYWVFYGALSDVEYTITVKNLATGATKTYVNPQRNLASVADTSAFPG
ncbi:MAG TPA: hypothetical protein VHR17_00590 [Thermoanaerobaculia bacterium]|nr:hypothetical protein [Thermoanaerobaculia bacterium]